MLGETKLQNLGAELDDLRAYVAAQKELGTPDERRAIREAAGITQQRIADTIGVSSVSVLHWEHGTRRPRGENLYSYLAVLRILKEHSKSANGADGE